MLPLIAAFGLFGIGEVRDFLRRLLINPHDPRLWPFALAWLVATLWGARWLLIGALRGRGPWDGLLGSRAAFKAAIGVGAGYVLRGDAVARWFGGSFWTAMAWIALLAVATWCAVTGVTKVAVLAWGRPGVKAPKAHPAPRGRAGNASAAEARHAMQGGGGERLRLDDREF